MAKDRIPDALERRHLIEKELPAEQALGIAEAYLAEERLAEAVAFLGKAGADERLERLAETAVEQGDAFLLTEVSKVRRREPEAAQWERLEASARRLGKLFYAEAAQRQASRVDD